MKKELTPEELEARRQRKRAYNKDWYEANKEIARQRSREYHALNREECNERSRRRRQLNPGYHRAYHFKNKYSLTVEQANEMYSKGCSVCGAAERLRIDHDHQTNELRGVLCHACNIALGHYERRMLPHLDQFRSYFESHNIPKI